MMFDGDEKLGYIPDSCKILDRPLLSMFKVWVENHWRSAPSICSCCNQVSTKSKANSAMSEMASESLGLWFLMFFFCWKSWPRSIVAFGTSNWFLSSQLKTVPWPIWYTCCSPVETWRLTKSHFVAAKALLLMESVHRNVWHRFFPWKNLHLMHFVADLLTWVTLPDS